MSQIDTPELDRWLEQKVASVTDFRANQPGLWSLISGAYVATTTLLAATRAVRHVSLDETHRLMMWQTVFEYQMDSLFLLLDKRLDAGLAILRMASELTRDVVRLAEDSARLEIWLKKSEKDVRHEYRKKFRFSDSDPLEKHVHQLYDICSDWGIHSHITGTSSLDATGATGDGKFIVMEIPEVEVFRSLRIWLASFFPIQHLCARSFVAPQRDSLREPHTLFLNMWKAFDDAFATYQENLRKWIAESKKGH